MDHSPQPPRPDPRPSDGTPPPWHDLLAAAGDTDAPEPILDLMRPREDRRP